MIGGTAVAMATVREECPGGAGGRVGENGRQEEAGVGSADGQQGKGRRSSAIIHGRAGISGNVDPTAGWMGLAYRRDHGA